MKKNGKNGKMKTIIFFSKSAISVLFLSTVRSCIKILGEILTQDEFNLVLAKYFAKLHDENTLSQTTELTEWEIFIQISLKLFGFPESSIKSLKVRMNDNGMIFYLIFILLA